MSFNFLKDYSLEIKSEYIKTQLIEDLRLRDTVIVVNFNNSWIVIPLLSLTYYPFLYFYNEETKETITLVTCLVTLRTMFVYDKVYFDSYDGYEIKLSLNNKIYKFDGTNSITHNMFSVKYQLFLNDIYYWGTTELLTYAMVKTYLEDIDFLLTTEKQIRFNKRQDRLYVDIDWGSAAVGNWIIIDCFRTLDPNDYSRVWNDSFLKPYLTALIKRQWGQNMMKFTGVKLPGGVDLNGRQMYEDGQREIDLIMERMSNTYELPPLDMIG